MHWLIRHLEASTPHIVRNSFEDSHTIDTLPHGTAHLPTKQPFTFNEIDAVLNNATLEEAEGL